MPDEIISKRLACLQALTDHLRSEITIVNGYKHELTDAVFRGRLTFDNDDPLPMVSILESPNPDRFPNRAGDQDGYGAVQKDLWTILVQGWAVDDKVNPTDPAYELMADVKKALAKLVAYDPETGNGLHPNFSLGGLIVGMEYEGGTVRPPDDQSSKAFFWMRVILKFVENVNDPFDHS
jgi:hypothetical protein